MNPFYRCTISFGTIGTLFVSALDSKVDTPPSQAVGHMMSVATSTMGSSAMPVTLVANTIDDGVYDTWLGRRRGDDRF